MSTKSSPCLSVALVLLSGISWGVISIFVRTLAAHGVTPVQIASGRALGAVLIVGLMVLLCHPEQLRIRLKDLWCFLGTGIGSIALFNLCYFAAMQRMSVGLAVILLYTSPVFVTLFSRICFKEKLSRRKVLAIGMVLCGCVMVCGLEKNCVLTLGGLLLGIGSGVFYALFSIFGRYAQQRGYSSLAITFWTFVCASVALGGFMSWGHIWNVIQTTPNIAWYWGGLVVISTVLPYFCYTHGLKGLELASASVIVAIEPVTAAIVGLIAFNEKLTMLPLVGMALVLGAIVFLGRTDG